MKLSKSLTLGVIAFVTTWIFVYVIHFHNAPLSDSTSDWGAWGSYVSAILSIVSILLIYITYDEQRKSNHIVHFETFYHVALKTMNELYSKNQELIESLFEKVEVHFANQLDTLENYERKNIQNILGYYYSLAVVNSNNEVCEDFFEYLDFILRRIYDDCLLDFDNQRRCFIEVSYFLPESVRILFLCWKSQDKCRTDHFYELEFYHMKSTSNMLLKNVIDFVFTGKRPKNENIECNEKYVNTEDYSEEELSETYNRLYNNKTQQQ